MIDVLLSSGSLAYFIEEYVVRGLPATPDQPDLFNAP